MNRIQTSALLTTALLSFSSVSFAGCELVSSTPTIPDGNVASQDELVAAQKAYKLFDAEVTEYRDCLVKEAEEIKAAGGDEQEVAAKLAANLEKDDAAVDALVGVAEEFNVAVRAFKERQ